jgi:hypothetical protein
MAGLRKAMSVLKTLNMTPVRTTHETRSTASLRPLVRGSNETRKEKA